MIVKFNETFLQATSSFPSHVVLNLKSKLRKGCLLVAHSEPGAHHIERVTEESRASTAQPLFWEHSHLSLTLLIPQIAAKVSSETECELV